jgi:hypothetical protein
VLPARGGDAGGVEDGEELGEAVALRFFALEAAAALVIGGEAERMWGVARTLEARRVASAAAAPHCKPLSNTAWSRRETGLLEAAVCELSGCPVCCACTLAMDSFALSTLPA